jgi:hypothetical protein
MALTDEVLDLERAAGRAADEAGRRADSREVYVAAAALGTGAGALLLVGSALGWWSGWGLVLLGLDVVVAAGLALGRAAAGRTGRAVAPTGARLALGVGIGAAVLAPDWAPWWLRAGAALAVAAAGALSLTVLSVPVDPVEGG